MTATPATARVPEKSPDSLAPGRRSVHAERATDADAMNAKHRRFGSARAASRGLWLDFGRARGQTRDPTPGAHAVEI